MRQYRRPPRPNPQWMYKGFYIVQRGSGFDILDITGSPHGRAASRKEAGAIIDSLVAQKMRRVRAAKNPSEFFGSKMEKELFAERKKLEAKAIKEHQRKFDKPIARRFMDIRTMPANYVFQGSPETIVITSKWGTTYHQTRYLKDNPLTRAEASNIRAEAAIHKRIATMSQRPIKKAYYQGMGAGMIDTAEQYAENPPGLKDIGYNHYIVSGALAGRLARESSTGRLPKPGHEILISYEGENYFLKRDRYMGKTVWVIHGPTGWKPSASGGMVLGNPRAVEVYENLKEIIAVKGPGHKCDAACKRARHTYRHKFTSRPRVFGNPDGSLTIK